MKYVYSSLLLCLAMSCSPGTSSQETEKPTDTASAFTEEPAITASPAEPEIPDSLYSKVDENLTGVDTLYNVLARQRKLIGSLVSVEVVTDMLLETNRIASPRSLTAALIRTYSENGEFHTTYNMLVVYDPDSAAVIAHLSAEVDNEFRELFSSTTPEPIELVTNQFAVQLRRITGDPESKKEEIRLYAMVDGDMTMIFDYTASDYSYTSDADGNSSATTIRSDLFMSEIGNEMPVITLISSTDRKVVSDEGEDNQPATEPDSEIVYKFDGRLYDIP